MELNTKSEMAPDYLEDKLFATPEGRTAKAVVRSLGTILMIDESLGSPEARGRLYGILCGLMDLRGCVPTAYSPEEKADIDLQMKHFETARAEALLAMKAQHELAERERAEMRAAAAAEKAGAN